MLALPQRGAGVPPVDRGKAVEGGNAGMCAGGWGEAKGITAGGRARSVLLPTPVTSFFLPAAVRGTRLDFGRLLQRSSTSATRMGHVRVRDGFYLFPPLPGRVPLWHGDSD